MDTIFIQGWLTNALIYGAIYLLAEHAIYKILFNKLVGSPTFSSYQDLKYWSRKASFIGAVIFAPLYEEVMFTYLAYTSFLHYAQADAQGLVIIFVACFFALLHLPGDIRQQGNSLAGIDVRSLLKFQTQRFFYSLTAYFIYRQTGALWITIMIHYLYNAIVSVYQFDVEDRQFAFQDSDASLLIILIMNVGFGIVACYYFFLFYPTIGLYLLPVLVFVLYEYWGGLSKLKFNMFS